MSSTNLDLKHPETQRGLANLQLMDSLTGQMDRHEGNIFVDPKSGSVKGIDNDLAFGKADRKQLDGVGNTVSYRPSQVDEAAGQAVLDMSQPEYAKLLAGKDGDLGRLSGEEREAAIRRLVEMQDYIGGLKAQNKLIGEGGWGKETYQKTEQEATNYLDEMLNTQNGTEETVAPSYGARHLAHRQINHVREPDSPSDMSNTMTKPARVVGQASGPSGVS